MTKEYERFDSAMRELIKVPHAAIKKQLDAEKRAKARKKRVRAAPASRASRAKD